MGMELRGRMPTEWDVDLGCSGWSRVAEEEPWEEMRFLSRQQALQHSWGSMQLLPGVLKE